jgi:hypothetical protein
MYLGLKVSNLRSAYFNSCASELKGLLLFTASHAPQRHTPRPTTFRRGPSCRHLEPPEAPLDEREHRTRTNRRLALLGDDVRRQIGEVGRLSSETPTSSTERVVFAVASRLMLSA